VDDFTRFQRAGELFGQVCSDTAAPQATYQALFAHVLEEYEPLPAVRELVDPEEPHHG
jgi:hypothetical protein